ncbi:uncharacterized protein [Rutidosis leptorrhynchoides]|uniref:uncharacterized protein n=1 Tax=Rutidosis leptorrhynchoides TaxID=125765 RepID=UPI003A9A5677
MERAKEQLILPIIYLQWRFHTESNSLWAKVITSIYGSNGGLSSNELPSQFSFCSTWNSIIKAGRKVSSLGIPFTTSFQLHPGDGSATDFWSENWLGGGDLRSRYSRLFHLDQNKEAKVADRVSWHEGGCNFNWQWNRELIGRNRDMLEEMILQIREYFSNNNSNATGTSGGCFWLLAANGRFTTKKMNAIILEKVLAHEKSQPESLKNSLVPKKVEVFIWRARRKRLPSLLELDRRGVDLHSVRCPMCDDDVETIDHVLIFCKIAYDVWTRIYKWWGHGAYSRLSIIETFEGSLNRNTSELGAKIWQAVEWSSGYILWKYRNMKIFKNKKVCAPSIVNEIQIMTFEWISKRLKGPKLEWCSWLSDPQIYLQIN